MRNLILVLGVLSVAACSGDSNGGAGDPTPRDTYPAAPYGLTEGSVIENHTFVDSEGQPFTLNDVFEDSKNRVLLITTTAGWCTACRDEQPRLAALYQELEASGLMVLAAYFEDDEFRAGTVAQAKGWKELYKLPFPVLLDEPFVLSKYYDRTATPMNMLIDVDTMTILKITTGFDETLVRGVIEANLDL